MTPPEPRRGRDHDAVRGPGAALAPEDGGTPWAAGRLDGRRGPSRLLFGRTFEDPAIESSLFPPGGTVACIAGAGDTARALAGGGRHVIAVDVNPRQLAEVRRRLAGEPPREGTVDRLLAVGRALLVPLGWRPARLVRFCRLDDPAEQVREWRRLTGPLVRAALAAGLSPWALRLAYGPGFTRLVPARFADRLVERIGRRIRYAPNRANPWLAQLLTGARATPRSSSTPPSSGHLRPSWGHPSPKFRGDTALPPGSEVVGARAATATATGAIDLRLGDVVDVLDGLPGGALDGVSLSNVLDGPGPAYRRRLLAAARRACRPGAPIVVRTLLPPADARAAARADTDRSLIWGGITVHRA